jgi:thiol-disulfide isomerase/thioredoxin
MDFFCCKCDNNLIYRMARPLSLAVIKKQIFILALFIFSIDASAQGNADTSTTQIRIGGCAPSFSLPKLDLKYISLRDYCGDELRKPWINKIKYVVVLSFFATWCKPCIAEIPHLEKIEKDFEGLPIKFFLIDVGEDRDKVIKFIKDRNIELTVLLDRYNKISEKYGVLSLPHLMVIDKNGIIRKIQNGFSNAKSFEKEMITLFFELLEENDSKIEESH